MRTFLTFLLCTLITAPAWSASKIRKSRHAAAPTAPVILLHPPRVSTEPITFVWPPEGMVLAAENEFLFGSVSIATALFTVNGQTVPVHKDGGFIAWLPISAGSFTFRASLELSSGTAVAERTILVPVPPVPLPDTSLAIDKASLAPKCDLELRAGDRWVARMKATRGKSARLRVGKGPWWPMREVNPKLGIYEAMLSIAPGEEFPAAAVEYEISSGWSTQRATGTVRISATGRAPLVAIVKTTPAGFANIKTEPNQGFLIFPPPGTRLNATGREGDSVRIDLGGALSGWIDAKDVDISSMTIPPHAETGNIGVVEVPGGAMIRFGLSDRVPFDVVEGDSLDSLTIRVFSAVGHTNIVTYDGGSDFVDFVRWRQEATGVVAYTVRLKPGRKLWGWNARYDNGPGLRLDLRRPPKIDRRRPLAGIKVMLDPGHMPSAHGATGPLGTFEMDANYAIAKEAAAKFEKAGATILLTRGTTTDEVSLVDRPKLAVDRGADIFISLHNNALPDGTNPFGKPRGFTVFYYHTHSLALGRAVHAAYAAVVPVPDEGLQWDNLLVARLSAVPAILVENAYMIFPEQEALLNDPQFRSKLADALVSGTKKFLLENGEKK